MIDNFYSKLETWENSDDYKFHLKEEKEKKVEINEFLEKYSIDKILTMPINDYVIGRNNKKSFCHMIENTFKCFGRISGRTSAYQKYVIYYSEEYKDYLFGDKRTKKRKGFGNNKDEIYENVKKEIYKIIKASENDDYKTIADSPLNPQFKNKIAFIYNYDNEFPVYSDDDLNVILTIFDIPFDKNEDRAFKREKIIKFYKETGLNNRLSTYMFMSFIYGWYGYRAILRSDEKPVVTEFDKISEYSLIDIQIDTPIHIKRTGNGTKRKIIFNPDTEESKKITGRKAEDIVIEYLKNHKNELNIKKIYCWCNGENKDDGKGYDISYIQNDGEEIFIEVKATKTDLKEQVYFEMSANEFSVMKAHPKNYYVFFVNNVNQGKIIRRILGEDIYGEEPIKYRINFDSKKKNSSGELK